MINKIASLACACALCGCMLAFGGCTSDAPEMQVREDLAQTLDQVSQMDVEKLDAFVEHSPEGMDSLRSYGVDARNFARGFFEDFDYSIDDLRMEDGVAKVAVTLKGKSFEDFEAVLYERVAKLVRTKEFQKLSKKERKVRIGDEIMAAIEDVEPQTALPLSLEMTKGKDGWVFTEESQQELDAALFGFLSESEVDAGIAAVIESENEKEPPSAKDEGSAKSSKESEKA